MCRWTVESPACVLMDSVKTICRNSTLNHGKDAKNQQQYSVFNVKSLETDCMFVFMYLFPPHCNIIRIKPVVSLQPQILMLYFIVVVVFRITSNLHHTEAVCCTCPVYIRPSLSV